MRERQQWQRRGVVKAHAARRDAARYVETIIQRGAPPLPPAHAEKKQRAAMSSLRAAMPRVPSFVMP